MVDVQRRKLILTGLVTLILLVAVILVALTTSIDQQISDRFFDQSGQGWLVDHETSRLRLWFYDGPKLLVILFGVGLIGVVLRPSLARPGWFTRREAIFLLGCLAAVPAATGLIRNNSNVQCPIVLQQYGGAQSNESGHVRLSGFLEPQRPHGCWPSGHASAGFALLSLAWLKRRRSSKLGFALLGMTAGVAMGAYQVARGSHFASHVLVTGLLAVMLVSWLAFVLRIEDAAVGEVTS
jgi:membrane-associated PAP2 superfamily phosphatase